MTAPTASNSTSVPRAPAAAGFGAWMQGGAALVWLPQAAFLAFAAQGLRDGLGFASVLPPAAGILLLGLLRAAAESWASRQVYGEARSALSALRGLAVSALAARSPLDSRRAPSGLAASVLAEQAEALVPYLVRFQPAKCRAMLVPLVFLPAIAWFSWVAAIVLLIAAPLIPMFMAIVGWRAKAASEAQLVEMGSMNAFLLDRLRGLATLRSLGAVDATARRLGESAQSLRRRTMAVLRIAFLSSALLELFSALGVAMVAAYIGFHLLGTLAFGTWGQPLSLGEGLFVLLLAPAFFDPLRELSAVWHDRAAGEAALGALDGLSQGGLRMVGTPTQPFESEARSALSTGSAAPSIDIRKLTFSHADEHTDARTDAQAVFCDFDLHIAAGEHVAVMGTSGAGKTALLSLIAGLVPASEGEIAIGGIALTPDSAAALRSRIGWMGQRAHVFAGSVQDNVSLGRAGVDRARVDAAMRTADLDGVAQAHPGVALGEGGTGLSGGEAARLALARVAAQPDAGLLLVDEPTAHLDTETARRVADALIELAHGKTLIAVTHDPVFAARMHRTIRLEVAA